jgi:hypothetical protein
MKKLPVALRPGIKPAAHQKGVMYMRSGPHCSCPFLMGEIYIKDSSKSIVIEFISS